MKRLVLVIMLTVCASVAHTWDVLVDDVYYWQFAEKTTKRTKAKSEDQSAVNYSHYVEQNEAISEQQCQVQVIFIEDSVTLSSDTIVKAIIRK